MLKGLKYRLYPTREQESLLTRSFDISRWAYNWTIEQRNKHYAETGKTLSRFDLDRRITQEKKDKPWLRDVSDWVIKESINDCCMAYERFFSKKGGFPKFKSRKYAKESATWRQTSHKSKNHISIPRIGGFRFREHRPVEGDVKTVTITRTLSGRYYISFIVEDGKDFAPKPSKAETAVGIDVGLMHFCTLSDGTKVDNPRFGKSSEKRIKSLQRKLARQEKGSNRYKRTKRKLAREYEKVAQRRQAFLHELSRRLVDENQVIAIEDLNVDGMLKNHRLAKAVSDASWGDFVSMLRYKSEWYGTHLLECYRFYPSSKMCSDCGDILSSLSLDIREWDCPKCGVHHDRDVNAAINILNYAVASTVNGRGEKVRLSSVRGYPFHEEARLGEASSPSISVGG